VTHDDYIAALRSNAAALAAAGRAAEMDAPVPSCPEWTVHELLKHVGGHHRWVRGNLDRTPEDGMQPFNAYEPAPEDAAAAEWVEEGAAALADRLAEVGPDQRCWTWVPDLDATTGFWARRTANETAVHRWDMQNAAGAPEPVDAGHAVDAVDEYLAMLQVIAGDLRGDGETVHLHSTDHAGEWLVSLAPDGPAVSREHAKGDVAVRGPASDLLLVVLNRVPASTVETLGDEALLARWLEKTRF
jgi:uncharacterized protein (TIGR03083 family)